MSDDDNYDMSDGGGDDNEEEEEEEEYDYGSAGEEEDDDQSDVCMYVVYHLHSWVNCVLYMPINRRRSRLRTCSLRLKMLKVM